MYFRSFERVIQLFARFPGIGTRQATRFTYFLADEPEATRAELVAAIQALNEIRRCDACFRFLEKNSVCSICVDSQRAQDRIAVIERDSNLETIERAGVYTGQYFILGTRLSELNEVDARLQERFRKLLERIRSSSSIAEVILAMDATPEGQFTSQYITKILDPLQKSRALKITHLGRGISSGAEIEYLNRDTLKDALENRR